MDSKAIVQQLLIVPRLLRPSRKLRPSQRSHRIPQSSRPFTSASCQRSVPLSPREELTGDKATIPRWRQTPASMQMPFQVRRPANQPPFKCNEDPEKLHGFYDLLLGKGGWQVLTEDTRWLAVTHKSFDQGRRGFNARLSYLGKRIVELQYSLAILSIPAPSLGLAMDGERTPFKDSNYQGLDNLTAAKKESFLSINKLANIGQEYGLQEVIRWKPNITTDLAASGQSIVVAQAMYAVIGAIALERGGVDANRVVKERILRPSGLLASSES